MATLPNVSPTSPPEVQVAVLNQVIDLLNAQQKLQSINDGTSTRFILGYYPGRWPNGDFGIAIAQSGGDATTADFKQLLFAWDFSTGTQYWNFNGINYRQDGILPDGTGGLAIAKAGENVASAF
jgi:hypothetical protein